MEITPEGDITEHNIYESVIRSKHRMIYTDVSDIIENDDRELAAFSQFGSELDEDTRNQLAQGERIKEILKQPQYKPMPVEKQVVIIYAATRKYLLDIEVDRILEFESGLFEYISTNYPDIFEKIREEKKLSDELEDALKKAITEFKETF